MWIVRPSIPSLLAALTVPLLPITGPLEDLSGLRMIDRRVATVAYRLSVANLDLCPIAAPLVGWALHSEDIYSPELRGEAIRTFSLRPNLPSVLALASDGSAAAARIREDDVLTAVNGQPLAADDLLIPDQGYEATYDRLRHQIGVIDTALSGGPSEITVERAGHTLSLIVVPEDGCPYEAQVVPSPEMNGGADGERISITSSLVAYTTSDDELAFLLAHELAHNILRHSERPRASSTLSAIFGRSGRTPSAVRRAEMDADRVGLFLSARAGYSISGAPAFRRRFARDHAAARVGLWGYPSGEERARAHEATLREIEALRARGAPLLP